MKIEKFIYEYFLIINRTSGFMKIEKTKKVDRKMIQSQKI